MARKVYILLLTFALTLLLLAGCAAGEPDVIEPYAGMQEAPPPAAPAAPGVKKLAFINSGPVTDHSLNQSIHEAMDAYSRANGMGYGVYTPVELDDDAIAAAIEQAIDGGAGLIVLNGYRFETALFTAQDNYPYIHFILIDGQSQSLQGDIFIAENTACVLFREEQAGFLAGYAAVREGYTDLGFIGGEKIPPVDRFGYGFLQGADYAAGEMGVRDITVKYAYAGTFEPDDGTRSMAAFWYDEGTEVIFASCGGSMASVIAAAENSGGRVIASDADLSALSQVVIASAVRDVQGAVASCLADYYQDNFPGGRTQRLGVSDGALSLSVSRLEKFTRSDYAGLVSALPGTRILGDSDSGGNPYNIYDLDLKIIQFVPEK
jgi:basic membrane protein A